MKVDEPSILPYFLELLSVKDSGIDKIPIKNKHLNKSR
jgi:hypothetical protein